MSEASNRAKAILCGAIAKAQRGELWTDHHPADAVDAILAAARAQAEDIVARALGAKLLEREPARDGWARDAISCGWVCLTCRALRPADDREAHERAHAELAPIDPAARVPAATSGAPARGPSHVFVREFSPYKDDPNHKRIECHYTDASLPGSPRYTRDDLVTNPCDDNGVLWQDRAERAEKRVAELLGAAGRMSHQMAGQHAEDGAYETKLYSEVRQLREQLAASEREKATARAEAFEEAQAKMLDAARRYPNDVFTQAFRAVRELCNAARAKAAASPGPTQAAQRCDHAGIGLPGCTTCDPMTGPRAGASNREPARLDASGDAQPKTILTAPVVTSTEGTSSAGPATTLVDTGTGERTALSSDEPVVLKSGKEWPPLELHAYICRGNGIVFMTDKVHVPAAEQPGEDTTRYVRADAPNPLARLRDAVFAYRDGSGYYGTICAEVDRLRAAERGGAK